MTLVLLAHGTRDPAGAEVAATVAGAVHTRLPAVPVELAFADVRAPNLAEVLRRVPGPAVLVPAFLASGYHVRLDVPRQVARSGRSDVVIAPALGPAPELVDVVCERVRAAGARPGDALVLAAAGSTDAGAVADVRRAAALLSARTGVLVRIGYLTARTPRLADVVRNVRRSAGRVAVASWLLAPGLFHGRVVDSGADIVADPIGAHPALADLIVRRYADAVTLVA